MNAPLEQCARIIQQVPPGVLNAATTIFWSAISNSNFFHLKPPLQIVVPRTHSQDAVIPFNLLIHQRKCLTFLGFKIPNIQQGHRRIFHHQPRINIHWLGISHITIRATHFSSSCEVIQPLNNQPLHTGFHQSGDINQRSARYLQSKYPDPTLKLGRSEKYKSRVKSSFTLQSVTFGAMTHHGTGIKTGFRCG